jgi:hypothetical protein
MLENSNKMADGNRRINARKPAGFKEAPDKN